MEQDTAATQLEALGNTTRLLILEQLAKAGKNGLNVSEINKLIEIPASTLSHHLARLINCGLLTQERVGRSLVCRADTGAMDSLVMYLANNCCGDDSGIWA